MKSQIIWNNKSWKRKIQLSRSGQVRQLYGLFFVHGKKNVTINIDVRHLASETESLIVLRGLVVDQAAVNIRGNVFIKKGAKGAKTHFEAKALLLSDQARCEIIPALEIDENEVKASHGTYVGKLDEEELFYLRSRGISEKHAKQILIQSFLDPITRYMSRSDLAVLLPKLLRSDLGSD